MAKYKEEQESRYIARTVLIISELPSFCTVFYDKNQTTFLPKTQYDYARSMRLFLQYLQQTHEHFIGRQLSEYTLEDLEVLTVKDANDFIHWLQEPKQEPDSQEIPSKNEVLTKKLTEKTLAENIKKMSISSIKTRISCISAYFTFFAKNGQLSGNPFIFAEKPKQNKNQENSKKDLKSDDKSKNLNESNTDKTDNIETRNDVIINPETDFSSRKKRFHEQYGLRDEIICKLLLETEIRISELAELNIQDFDLKNHRFYVYRTKQKSLWMTISEELSGLIEKYLEERSEYKFEKDMQAMFLVTIGRYKGARLGVRSIERIVSTIRKRQL